MKIILDIRLKPPKKKHWNWIGTMTSKTFETLQHWNLYIELCHNQPTNKNHVPSEIHRLLAAELDRSEEVVLHGIGTQSGRGHRKNYSSGHDRPTGCDCRCRCWLSVFEKPFGCSFSGSTMALSRNFRELFLGNLRFAQRWDKVKRFTECCRLNQLDLSKSTTLSSEPPSDA